MRLCSAVENRRSFQPFNKQTTYPALHSFCPYPDFRNQYEYKQEGCDCKIFAQKLMRDT